MEALIRKAEPEEHQQIGQIMVQVYSSLPGFPKPAEQPAYYHKLKNVGSLTTSDHIDLFVAEIDGQVVGAVLFINDMSEYGSGGQATKESGAGFRLLSVLPTARGKGIGKLLSKHCIRVAQRNGHDFLFIHTTEAMKLAWGMYERLGFERYEPLDFVQEGFPVFGFKLDLK